MLQEVYPTTKLILDEKAGRILAVASIEEQARIKQTDHAQLDAAGPPDLEESLKTYATDQVNPVTLLPDAAAVGARNATDRRRAARQGRRLGNGPRS